MRELQWNPLKSSFRLYALLVSLACAGWPSVVAAQSGSQSQIAWDASGALAVRMGDQVLIHPSVPQLWYFDWMQSGEPVRPDYAWMMESNRDFNARSQTHRVVHQWGRYTVTWKPGQDRVDVAVTVMNTLSQPIVTMKVYLTGIIKFAAEPKGYHWQHKFGVFGGTDEHGDARPAVAVADIGKAAVLACISGADNNCQLGFAGGENPRIILRVHHLQPGEIRTVVGSLRLVPGSDSGRNPAEIAKDIYADFAERHPLTVSWPDRRPIATLHPSSAHLGAGTVGPTSNPRGWIGGTPAAPLDVTTEAGLTRFKSLMFNIARYTVRTCNEMNAQGVICWSIEGQQYPHTISYIGSPDKLAELAPEMDAIADEWFQVFTEAGLQTGVCLRPQELRPKPHGFPDKPPFKYEQSDLWDQTGHVDAERVTELLADKLRYAKERWGCTLFYVDSNRGSKYGIDPQSGKVRQVYSEMHSWAIYQELSRRFPDCLIMPEHETHMYWSCTAPIGATPQDVARAWPEAFSVNLMQNFNPDDEQAVQRIESFVRRGDILLFPGWYPARENAVVKGVYQRNHVPRWHGDAQD